MQHTTNTQSDIHCYDLNNVYLKGLLSPSKGAVH